MTRMMKLRWASVFFTAIGLADSIYLTYIKVAHKLAACSTIGDCESVNNSVYSEIGGIPIALLGAGAYLLILLVLLLEGRLEILQKHGPQIVYGITLIGVLYSAYLTYVEIAILRAVCPYCVASAITITIVFVLNLIRLFGEHSDTLVEAE